jgi:hypothetical protein
VTKDLGDLESLLNEVMAHIQMGDLSDAFQVSASSGPLAQATALMRLTLIAALDVGWTPPAVVSKGCVT